MFVNLHSYPLHSFALVLLVLPISAKHCFVVVVFAFGTAVFVESAVDGERVVDDGGVDALDNLRRVVVVFVVVDVYSLRVAHVE